MTERLTRKQRQEHTRHCLLEAAARVFARRGLVQASVDEVAADAGYTKGAVYANFGSKEELFLEMLDARFARRLADMDRALSTDEPPEAQARAAGRDFVDYLSGDPEWARLFFEAALYAAREEGFRTELQSRYAAMRSRMAAVLRARSEAGGFDPGLPFDQLAAMIFAMANGVAFERFVEPDAVPDDLFASMLELFTLGAASRQPRPS
ncbi:MAG TPA: TetR/AcrR family transcriptional regulator [Baekduia sp.]|uniref:TetR/AcrR family transcriptional regulator n=1 Tax=Baekduia sp. TaxID=2600305 RepID=UPI002C8CBADB|nr:TetR/AcrR family transcriptional regulator [Baekduia sp.]HMJ34126.1 TetR/AcrR family transcriptional regulator [Baekduia sp.]